MNNFRVFFAANRAAIIFVFASFAWSLSSFMHQSIPPAPSSPPHPPGQLRGTCPPCQSRGWGICKCCTARGPGICQPLGQSRAFDTHTVSYQNITTRKVLLEDKQIGSFVKDRNKIVEGCNGMFSISHVCMHFFIGGGRVGRLGADGIDWCIMCASIKAVNGQTTTKTAALG